MTQPAGLLLLTGGKSSRFGGPKHAQPHPDGGTWASHLVDTFLAVFPGGPVEVLGLPLADRPGLKVTADDGQGPARALVHWAARPHSGAPLRWWVVACDQVAWTAASLEAWHREAVALDPEGKAWVLARVDGHAQYVGSFLAAVLLRRLPDDPGAASLRALARQLPCVEKAWPGACWQDVDTPEALARWLETRPRP